MYNASRDDYSLPADLNEINVRRAGRTRVAESGVELMQLLHSHSTAPQCPARSNPGGGLWRWRFCAAPSLTVPRVAQFMGSNYLPAVGAKLRCGAPNGGSGSSTSGVVRPGVDPE